MNVWNRELYYFNTEFEFETEQFAGRFLRMLLREIEEQGKTEVVFLCIGTDRSTGDSLGPLIGYKLMKCNLPNAHVVGTLDHPVHAMNLDHYVSCMKEMFADSVVVAIDASVGNVEHIGYVTLGRGPLKPGLGVKKEIEAVGDLFITGIVGSAKSRDPFMLQSVRLSMVMRLADYISNGVLLGMSANQRIFRGKSVDKFARAGSSL